MTFHEALLSTLGTMLIVGGAALLALSVCKLIERKNRRG